MAEWQEIESLVNMISFLCLVVVVCLMCPKSQSLCIPFPVSIYKVRNNFTGHRQTFQSPSQEAQFSKLTVFFLATVFFLIGFGVASS
jgi:hypothetical protein